MGRFRGVQGEDKICKLCRIETKTEMHLICSAAPIFYEIKKQFHCLFREGFGPLARVMNYTDQQCLGLFLLEIHRFRDSLLKKPHHKGNTQKEITNFFKVQTKLSGKKDSAQVPNSRGSTRGDSTWQSYRHREVQAPKNTKDNQIQTTNSTEDPDYPEST